MTLKAQLTDRKIDKLDFMKIKNFGASKYTTNRVKRQPREMKEIFTNHISDKGFIIQDI